MSFEPLAIAGVGLVVLAVGWRALQRARVRRGVRGGLRDADASVRIAAVAQAADLGLAAMASGLLRAVRAEQDSRVLAAVIEAVAARQWEPASNAAIVELRLWAKAYAESRPELHRPHPGTPPLFPGVAGAVPPPSLDPDRAAEFRRRVDTVGGAEEAGESLPLPPPDPDPLHPVRVLVTGAGGPAGVSVVRALRAAGHFVVAVDADPAAVGLRLAHEGHRVPRFDDPSYLAGLIRVGTVTGAQAIVCTVAEEYGALAAGEDYLHEAGLRTCLPPAEGAEATLDKWRFFKVMTEAGLPVPATGLGDADGVPGPWIVKPRRGRGSRDVVLADTKKKLQAALALVPDPIVQTQIEGREFTVDLLAGDDGTVLGAVPRWRLATKAGISTHGETFDDAEVMSASALAIKTLGHRGPANVQGFVTEDGSNRVVLIEINPRFSGGLPLSLHAGADLVGEYLRMIMGRDARPERLVAQPGVTMLRHYEEIFE